VTKLFNVKLLIFVALIFPCTVLLAVDKAKAKDAGGRNVITGDGIGQEPKLVSSLQISLPRDVANLPIQEPRAVLRVRVGQTGKVLDCLCVEAFHLSLRSLAEKAVKQALFEPAMVEEKPVISDFTLILQFQQQDIVSQSIIEHIDSNQYRVQAHRFHFGLSGPRELDAPLEIINRGETYMPVRDSGEIVHGMAVVEFFVDPDGRPRLLRIERSDDPEISKAAQLTFQELRFTPPRNEGRPTVVKTRLPFEVGE